MKFIQLMSTIRVQNSNSFILLIDYLIGNQAFFHISHGH